MWPDRGGGPGLLSSLMRLAAEESASTDATSPDAEQAYKEDQVNEALKKDHFKIAGELMDGKPPAGGWAEFDSYYSDYFLARWSVLGKSDHRPIANLPECRKQVRNDLHRAKGDVHDHLNALVLEFMKAHAAENYHPAVRVNAMLMIGDLNRVEPTGSAAAIPLPEALTMLLDAVKSSKPLGRDSGGGDGRHPAPRGGGHCR